MPNPTPSTPALLSLPDAPGVFCDAHLIDNGGPLFLSLWGRDTALQELLARLSLPETSGGLTNFAIGDGRDPGATRVGWVAAERLQKVTARRTGTLFGDLAQLWLYDPLALTPDRANGRALLLCRGPAPPAAALWSLVRRTLWVPVLDAWREPLLDWFGACGWLHGLTGHGISGWRLEFSERDRLEQGLRERLRDGRLRVDV